MNEPRTKGGYEITRTNRHEQECEPFRRGITSENGALVRRIRAVVGRITHHAAHHVAYSCVRMVCKPSVSLSSGVERWPCFWRILPGIRSPSNISISKVILIRFDSESVLNERKAQASACTEFCGMSCVQKVCKKEANELEGDRDEHVPEEGEYCPGCQALYWQLAWDHHSR